MRVGQKATFASADCGVERNVDLHARIFSQLIYTVARLKISNPNSHSVLFVCSNKLEFRSLDPLIFAYCRSFQGFDRMNESFFTRPSTLNSKPSTTPKFQRPASFAWPVFREFARNLAHGVRASGRWVFNAQNCLNRHAPYKLPSMLIPGDA